MTNWSAQFIVEPGGRSARRSGSRASTASGPPLPVLIRALEMLRDYRMAAARPDLETRHADLARLRACLE